MRTTAATRARGPRPESPDRQPRRTEPPPTPATAAAASRAPLLLAHWTPHAPPLARERRRPRGPGGRAAAGTRGRSGLCGAPRPTLIPDGPEEPVAAAAPAPRPAPPAPAPAPPAPVVAATPEPEPGSPSWAPCACRPAGPGPRHRPRWCRCPPSPKRRRPRRHRPGMWLRPARPCAPARRICSAASGPTWPSDIAQDEVPGRDPADVLQKLMRAPAPPLWRPRRPLLCPRPVRRRTRCPRPQLPAAGGWAAAPVAPWTRA